MTTEQLLRYKDTGNSLSQKGFVALGVLILIAIVVFLVIYKITTFPDDDYLRGTAFLIASFGAVFVMLIGFAFSVLFESPSTEKASVSKDIYRVETVSRKHDSGLGDDESGYSVGVKNLRTKKSYKITSTVNNFIIGQRVRLQGNLISSTLHTQKSIVEYTFIKVDNINGDKQSTD